MVAFESFIQSLESRNEIHTLVQKNTAPEKETKEKRA